MNKVASCVRCSNSIAKARRNQRYCSAKCADKRPRLTATNLPSRSEDELKTSKNYNHRDRNLRRRGWTAQEYDAAVETQQGRCAICGSEETLHADHDHVTGNKRELLCPNCNKGLGFFKDNPELLQLAAFYLQIHQKIESDVIASDYLH